MLSRAPRRDGYARANKDDNRNNRQLQHKAAACCCGFLNIPRISLLTRYFLPPIAEHHFAQAPNLPTPLPSPTLSTLLHTISPTVFLSNDAGPQCPPRALTQKKQISKTKQTTVFQGTG